MNTLSATQSQDSLQPITEKLKAIYSLPCSSTIEVKEVLTELEATIEDLDRAYLMVSSDINILAVRRAAIIGGMCHYVKDSLLHGEWTEWAAEHFTESVRTLEKFMAIARSQAVDAYAHLGPEKAYQLTRIERLLSENTSFEDLFSGSGLDAGFDQYSCKGFERAVAIILNKQMLQEQEINLHNEAIRRLTENFNLIKGNHGILTRLAEAKSEDANLEKTVTNIVANGGGSRPVKAKKTATTRQEDINMVAKRFIELLETAKNDPAVRESIDENRLRFIGRLIAEYFQAKTN